MRFKTFIIEDGNFVDENKAIANFLNPPPGELRVIPDGISIVYLQASTLILIISYDVVGREILNQYRMFSYHVDDFKNEEGYVPELLESRLRTAARNFNNGNVVCHTIHASKGRWLMTSITAMST